MIPFRFLFLVEFPPETLMKLLIKMAEIECYLSAGSNENIQLTSLISAFYNARK